MAHVVSVWASTIHVLVVWELVLWIEHLVDVHNATALFQIFHGLFVFPSINVHDTAIEVVVFLVKDVFLVVVGLFSLLLISLIIGDVCTLRGVGTRL